MSTHETTTMEERLRAALSARADQVQPEHLAPLAAVVPLRPRWQSPWVLLATAAVVLLVLGVVFQGVAGGPRSDDLAPRPQQPEVDLPTDVGREWAPDDQASPIRLDLDGDGVEERVRLLIEPTDADDGRVRVQTRLSTTGEEAFGLARLGTTVAVTALDPIDADGDGDQEMVLYSNAFDPETMATSAPVVLDLRDGSLVQAETSNPELLASGYPVVPGSSTDYYDLVHVQSYDVRDGQLVSTRSVNAFARSGEEIFQPSTYVADSWTWTLDEDGVLQQGEEGCLVYEPEAVTACDAGSADDPPYVTSESTDTIGVGEETTLDDGGLGYRVRVDGENGPGLVVTGPGNDGAVFALSVPEPRVHVLSPFRLARGARGSVFVTSETDPDAMQVVVETADQAGLVGLDPVGDVPLGVGTTDDGREYRSWLTAASILVTVVANDGGSWQAWQWTRVGDQEMAAVPWGEICFDDVTDPTTGRAC